MNRHFQNIIKGIPTSDGAGVNLTRVIGSHELNMLDPFLLLDEFGSEIPMIISRDFHHIRIGDLKP